MDKSAGVHRSWCRSPWESSDFEAGGVDEGVFEIDRSLQIKWMGHVFGGGFEDAAGDELLVEEAQAGVADPVVKALAGAFGEDFDLVDVAGVEKPLEEGAIS